MVYSHETHSLDIVYTEQNEKLDNTLRLDVGCQRHGCISANRSKGAVPSRRNAVDHTVPYHGVVQLVAEAGALVCTARLCQQCSRARDRVTRVRSTEVSFS